jgi:exosortase
MSIKEKDKVSNQGFIDELSAFWRELPDRFLMLGLLLIWALLFQLEGNSTLGYVDSSSLFGWMHYAYGQSPDDAHGKLIPLAVLALLWWKRDELIETPKRHWWPALSLVALGLGLHIIGFMIQQTRISIVAFFIGLYGLTGLVWGPRWLKVTFFPFLLFAFCVPLSTLAEPITTRLRLFMTVISVWISQVILGIDVLREGTQIFDSSKTYQYGVEAACSGIRSITVLLALATIYGFVTFKKNWKRFLIIIMAVPIAVFGNTCRLLGLIIATETFGKEAGKKFHDAGGFLVFIIALVILFAIGYFLSKDTETKKEQEA